MTVDQNTVTSDKLVAHSIDFVEQFSTNVSTLLSAMGHVQMHSMSAGTLIQTYKKENTPEYISDNNYRLCRCHTGRKPASHAAYFNTRQAWRFV